MSKTQCIMTDESIVISANGGVYQVYRGTPVHDKVKALLDKRDYAAIDRVVDIPAQLRANGKFIVIGGELFYRDQPVPSALSNKIVQFCEADINCSCLVRFWENLAKNPSEDSKKDLFAFLEHNGIAITNDGCFIGYKRVNSDYTSMQNGVWVKNDAGEWYLDGSIAYDNSPGKVVSMPRDKVNPDRNQTCSSGLHIAAYNYANACYNSGCGRLVECKINPMNVVCVPPDYNQEKMRTCEYTVVRDCVEEYIKPMYEHDDSFTQDLGEAGGDYEGDIDEVDEVETTEENDVVVEDMKLTPDFRNRVRIPAAFIRAMGLNTGYKVYVSDGSDYLIVAPDEALGGTAYTIDEHYNVRINLNNFAEFAKMIKKNRRKSVTVGYDDNYNEVIVD